MVTDGQIRRLRKAMKQGKTVEVSAEKTGMSVKTARKYLKMGKLPSEIKTSHTWSTRTDAFEDDWNEIKELLEVNPGLEGKTVFDYLRNKQPGKYADGQIRTLQRRIKHWKVLNGPGKEIFFTQEHKPGILSQSDFTRMDDIGVTISKQPFEHMIYHFVLTYSNWETGSICFSESFESLSEGCLFR